MYDGLPPSKETITKDECLLHIYQNISQCVHLFAIFFLNVAVVRFKSNEIRNGRQMIVSLFLLVPQQYQMGWGRGGGGCGI